MGKKDKKSSKTKSGIRGRGILLGLGILILLSGPACQEEEILIRQGEEPGLAEEEKDGEKGKEEPADAGADETEESRTKEKAEEPEETIWVHISGAVNAPGVYELALGARVFEAVEAAGGFLAEADDQWLNQAAVLTDGEKLQIYTKEETSVLKEQGETEPAGESAKTASEGGKVNINTASAAELQEIPGIGEVRAQAILDYREEAGAFSSIEEIQEVPGIKGKTFEKIEEHITVK